MGGGACLRGRWSFWTEMMLGGECGGGEGWMRLLLMIAIF